MVLGSGGVGKSALTIRFTAGRYLEKYDPTIEDAYRKQVDVDGNAVMLDILDTAGQEEFGAMREQYMQNGQGFILVYSITDQTSFEDISTMYDTLVATKGTSKVPVVLVGNKCDLNAERAVETSEAEKVVAEKMQGVKFLEASAKDNINVDDIFIALVREINSMHGGPTDQTAAAAGTASGDQAAAAPPEEKKKKKKGGCSLL